MSALEFLIEHWRLYAPEPGHFVHRRDAPFMQQAPASLHLNVQAYPYVGHLKQADVWILMLNSKLGEHDVEEESTEPYRTLLETNLRQRWSDEEFPLLSVSPELEGTGTYEYYNNVKGLGALIHYFAGQSGLSEVEARKVFARRVAILELLPYRSAEFPGQIEQIPSVNAARNAAREAAAERLLIVPWGLGRWGLNAYPSVVNRTARNFTFAPHGAAGYGAAIVKRLMNVG